MANRPSFSARSFARPSPPAAQPAAGLRLVRRRREDRRLVDVLDAGDRVAHGEVAHLAEVRPRRLLADLRHEVHLGD